MSPVLSFVRKSAVPATLLLLAGYVFYTYYVPCKIPLSYRVGTIDSRFGLSQKDFIGALQEAEHIWERPAGTDLFDYKTDGAMPVSLVYDSRQALTQKNNQIKEVIDQTAGSADTVKVAYDEADSRYRQAKAEYVSAQAAYAQSLKQYNDKVAYANAHGGASPQEYRDLQSQKAALQRDAAALESQRQVLNALADQTNALSDRYNRLAGTVNEKVGLINQTAGTEFEEGVYSASAFGTNIDIYEYSSHDELVRVLAHELGHALGLPHNTNPDSIMYELNQSANSAPTAEDLADLRRVCSL